MISRELAKRLKDAGFPQTRRDATIDADEGDGVQPLMIPTLSELIEACDGEFGTLEKLGNQFIAVQPKNKHTILALSYQSSPEEAVARLYLSPK